jgi:hypothetical protein
VDVVDNPMEELHADESNDDNDEDGEHRLMIDDDDDKEEENVDDPPPQDGQDLDEEEEGQVMLERLPRAVNELNCRQARTFLVKLLRTANGGMNPHYGNPDMKPAFWPGLIINIMICSFCLVELKQWKKTIPVPLEQKYPIIHFFDILNMDSTPKSSY